MTWMASLRSGLAVLAATLATGFAATGAVAQEPPPSRGNQGDDAREALATLEGLQAEFNALARSIGQEAPDLRALFAPIFEAVFDGVPDDGEVSFSVGFRFRTQTTTAAQLEDAEETPPVHADAGACQAERPHMAVVHFERLNVPGGRGSHCVLHGPSTDSPGAWVMVGEYRVETPQRRLFSRVGAAAVAGDAEADTVTASVIGESQLSALIALSAQMGRTATELTFVERSGAD